jgi:MarR family transcriptional regulator, lower aerobic nicotinate degradation pathway regulator
MPARKTTPPPPMNLEGLPGHDIRRLQQIAVAIFLEETAEQGLTPVQFAALQTVADRPGLDQRTLALAIGYDTSTLAGVVDRLEARGCLERQASPDDRRVRLLAITREGRRLLAATVPGMLRTQERILAPLARAERGQFQRLLRRLVEANNELSRAPRGR